MPDKDAHLPIIEFATRKNEDEAEVIAIIDEKNCQNLLVNARNEYVFKDVKSKK